MIASNSEAAPHTSVVVTSVHGAAVVGRCLEALTRQAAAAGNVEVIVVGRWSPEDATRLQAQFPAARFLGAAPDANVAAMRTAGFRVARAPLLALLEDDCVPGPDWLAAVRRPRDPRVGAVGGAIEPGPYRRRFDWAVFFSEYGRFLPPLVTPPAQLPGTNVVYRREALDAGGALREDGFYETFVHEAIRRAGYLLEADSDLRVRQVNAWSPRAALGTRYHHGRGFAGLRVRGKPAWLRLFWAVGALALPIVLLTRTAAHVRRGRRGTEALLAAPGLVLCAVAWAAGECVGYLRGPGASLEAWR